MKPFDLYRFVISLTKEPYNTKKLPFYLARAKSALTKLKSMNWEDEDIKTIISATQMTVERNIPAIRI